MLAGFSGFCKGTSLVFLKERRNVLSKGILSRGKCEKSGRKKEKNSRGKDYVK